MPRGRPQNRATWILASSILTSSILASSILTMGLAPVSLRAQTGASNRSAALPQLERRIEVAPTPAAGIAAGLGVNVRAGYYARVGMHAVAGIARRDDGFVGVQRLEAVSRFLFDPFGEFPRGVYGGGGFAVRHTPGDPVRGDLVVVVGMEGPLGTRRTIPAVELALGGGARLSVVYRQRRRVGR
ncbi:MAG: hypothetical protein RLZZ63_1319 [Gemmatimonadota bacterium]|jgi:hypothetical protein